MSSVDQKWVVYRRGEPIGTFTAEEIREDLRKGVLKPSDFASAEGSMVRLQIVEIDEIFGIKAGLKSDSGAQPKQSRWADRAAALNLASAPITQPRQRQLPNPREPHPPQRRQPQQRPYRQQSSEMRQSGGADLLWIWVGIIAVVAIGASFYWLKMKR